MKLAFDLASVVLTEFGVGRDTDGERSFAIVPIDSQVQEALREMAEETRDSLDSSEEDPQPYEPSERYGSHEQLFISIADDLVTEFKNLHQAKNLATDTDALSEPNDLFCYFARFTDAKKRRLTAVRRATQFKGVLKSRLIRILSDTLQLVQDPTFKLDNDFDMLIDSTTIYILRPSGFEFVGRLQEAIREAVAGNIQQISKDLPFVNLGNIAEYAAGHTRAARHLASIRSQGEAKNVSQKLLRKACKTHSIELHIKDGIISVAAGSEMGFLDVLDRRRYEQELIEGATEIYKASNRRKVTS
jgi:hypothetical protein